jgi:hypothetical protein
MMSYPVARYAESGCHLLPRERSETCIQLKVLRHCPTRSCEGALRMKEISGTGLRHTASGIASQVANCRKENARIERGP